MRKRFNDTGICIPEKHFMADTRKSKVFKETSIQFKDKEFFAVWV